MHRGVAQLGSALRSGRRGRRFKSCHPDVVFPEVKGLTRLRGEGLFALPGRNRRRSSRPFPSARPRARGPGTAPATSARARTAERSSSNCHRSRGVVLSGGTERRGDEMAPLLWIGAGPVRQDPVWTLPEGWPPPLRGRGRGRSGLEVRGRPHCRTYRSAVPRPRPLRQGRGTTCLTCRPPTRGPTWDFGACARLARAAAPGRRVHGGTTAKRSMGCSRRISG